MRAEDNNFLPRLWATRRVGWLVEQIRSNGENKELRDEIVDLGTRYGIVTPYTSYLATDGSERRVENLPTNNRQFQVDGLSIGRRNNKADMNAPPPKSVLSTTGQGAVQDSKKAKEQQATVDITSEDDEVIKTGTVKKVGAKTFYLENDVWIDSEFKEEANKSEVKLKFASDDYFNLIAKEKDLAQYFALGEQVVVVWKGKVYRIIK